MDHKDIAEKIVRIAESLMQEEAGQGNQDYKAFFDASDELESVEAELKELSADFNNNVDVIEEDDMEEMETTHIHVLYEVHDASSKENELADGSGWWPANECYSTPT